MAHIPGEVSVVLQRLVYCSQTSATILEGRFSADVVSCNMCGINRLGSMISQFVLVYFIPTLFGKGTLEASTLKECCMIGRGQAHRTVESFRNFSKVVFHSSICQACSQITNH